MDDACGYDGYYEEYPDASDDILTPIPKWAPAPPKKVKPKAKATGKGLLLNKASAPPPSAPTASWGQPPAKRMKVSGSTQARSEEQVVVSLTRLPQGYDQAKLTNLLEYCGLEPSCLLEVELSEPLYEAEEETIAARLTFDCNANALAACRELNGQEVSTMSGASEFLEAEIEHEHYQMQEEVPKAQGWKEAVLASLAPARKREVIVREPPRKEPQGAHIFVKKRKAPVALDDEQALLDYIEGKHDAESTSEVATPSAISRRNEDSCFVKVSSLPEGYDEAKLLGLFEFLEIDVHAIQSMRFLKPHRDQEVLTLSAVLHFDCHESASVACDELNGQEVMTRSNDVKRLVAQLTGDDTELGLGTQAHRQKKGGKKGGDQVGSQQILPSVYFSDVPKEFNNESMRQLHVEADVNADTIVSMKFLPARDDYGETCCCIIRYCDEHSAQEAIDALAGSKVLTSSGDRKFLGAKMAKPAAWMKNRW